MSNIVKITEEILQNTADAIREKLNSEETIKPVNFPQKISDIKMGKIYNVNITQSANQTIKVSEVTTYTNSQNSFTINTETYIPKIKANLTADTGYNKGTLNVSENTIITLSEGTTNISATPATIKQFTVTITQTENQTITVTCNGVDYTSSFTANYGDTWTASIVATNTDYNPGTLSASSGTITGAITISATAASVKRQIIITQVPGSTISVEFKGTTYTSSFYIDSILVGDIISITQTADSGYNLGNLKFNETTSEFISGGQTTYTTNISINSVTSSSFSIITTDINNTNLLIESVNNQITISQEPNIDLSNINLIVTVLDDFTAHQSLNVYVDNNKLSYGNTTINLGQSHSFTSIDYTVDTGYLAGDIYFALVDKNNNTEYMSYAQFLNNPLSMFNFDYNNGIFDPLVYTDENIRQIIIGFTKEAVVATLVTTLNNVNIGMNSNIISDYYSLDFYFNNLLFSFNSREYKLDSININMDNRNAATDDIEDIMRSSQTRIGINGIEVSDPSLNSLEHQFTRYLYINNIPKIETDLTYSYNSNQFISPIIRFIVSHLEGADNKKFYIKFKEFGSTFVVNSYHGSIGLYTVAEGYLAPIDVYYILIHLMSQYVESNGIYYISEEGNNTIKNFTVEIWRV